MLSKKLRSPSCKPVRAVVQSPVRTCFGASLLQKCGATKTADVYADVIRKAEEGNDWLAAFEALTEARVMKLELPVDAVEGGIRTLATGGQWSRAADMMDNLLAAGNVPNMATLRALLSALQDGKQVVRAQDLLQALQTAGADNQSLTYAQNVVVRITARSGRAIEAYGMLSKMITAKDVKIHPETYPCVCNELMKAGDADKAEEVLEWRDFLDMDD